MKGDRSLQGAIQSIFITFLEQPVTGNVSAPLPHAHIPPEGTNHGEKAYEL